MSKNTTDALRMGPIISTGYLIEQAARVTHALSELSDTHQTMRYCFGHASEESTCIKESFPGLHKLRDALVLQAALRVERSEDDDLLRLDLERRVSERFASPEPSGFLFTVSVALEAMERVAEGNDLSALPALKAAAASLRQALTGHHRIQEALLETASAKP